MEVIQRTWMKALEKGPACAMWALLLAVLSVTAAYVYAERSYAGAADVDNQIKQLAKSIEHGFEAIGARLDLYDAENLVRDLQAQVRQKEREIAALEMVITELPDAGDSGDVLRAQIFVLRQDLSEIKARLSAEQQNMLEARRAFGRASSRQQ